MTELAYALRVRKPRPWGLRNGDKGLPLEGDETTRPGPGIGKVVRHHPVSYRQAQGKDPAKLTAIASGMGFAGQLEALLSGMSATPEGEARIKAWLDAQGGVAPDNWLKRGWALNQLELKAQFDQALAAIETELKARSLRGRRCVGCEVAAAVHFWLRLTSCSPAFCPIAVLWGCKSGKNWPRWGPFSLSTPSAAQTPSTVQKRLIDQVKLLDKTTSLMDEAEKLRNSISSGTSRNPNLAYFRHERFALFLTYAHRSVGQLLFKTAAKATSDASQALVRQYISFTLWWQLPHVEVLGLLVRLDTTLKPRSQFTSTLPNAATITGLKRLLTETNKPSQGQLDTLIKVAMDNTRGEFFKLHLGSTLALLEAWNLSIKAQASGGLPERERLELFAACLATFAAALELGTITSKWALAKAGASNPALTEIWSLRLGGYRLTGGTLAGVAGLVGAWYDWVDAKKAGGEDKPFLMYILIGRSAFSGIGAGVGGLIAFSFSGPVWAYLAKNTSSLALQTAAASLEVVAKTLAKRQVYAAMVKVNWYLAAAVATLTALKFALDDTAIEAYCKRSIFRNPKFNTPTNPGYVTAKEELEALLKGIKELTE